MPGLAGKETMVFRVSKRPTWWPCWRAFPYVTAAHHAWGPESAVGGFKTLLWANQPNMGKVLSFESHISLLVGAGQPHQVLLNLMQIILQTWHALCVQTSLEGLFKRVGCCYALAPARPESMRENNSCGVIGCIDRFAWPTKWCRSSATRAHDTAVSIAEWPLHQRCRYVQYGLT